MPPQLSEVRTAADLAAALGPADPDGRSVALIGGADAMSEGDRVALENLFGRLAGYLESSRTAVVDGGTDSGVMRLIGHAREIRRGTFRLVGVTPRGALERTTSAGAPITVEPHHPEILLVPGTRFGDETEWLFGAADHLGGGAAPTIVVNGGKLTLDEAHLRLAAGHSVIVVAGSGRAADELATDEGLRASRRLRVVPMSADEVALAAALEEGREG